MSELTSREALFVAAYIQGKSAEAACVEAGYSPKYARKSAHSLLKRSKIAAAIREAQERIKVQSEMSAEKLLAMFMEAYAKAIEWRQSTGAVRAGEMIGKLTGLIQDKLKLEVEPSPDLRLAMEEGRRRVAALAYSEQRAILDVTPTEAVAADSIFGD